LKLIHLARFKVQNIFLTATLAVRLEGIFKSELGLLADTYILATGQSSDSRCHKILAWRDFPWKGDNKRRFYSPFREKTVVEFSRYEMEKDIGTNINSVSML